MTDADYAVHRKDLLYFLKCMGVFARKHAEDVTQDALLELHKRQSDPMAEPLKDTLAWLRSVACHRLTNLYKVESRSLPLSEKAEDGQEWVGEYFIDYMDPERLYMAREELDTLLDYIDPREYGPDETPSDEFRKRLERFRMARKYGRYYRKSWYTPKGE